MGMLIKKVVYNGDKYYFESPQLQEGIVILEGDNQHGKSTFMDLIKLTKMQKKNIKKYITIQIIM